MVSRSEVAIKTRDMTMATVLIMEGFSYELRAEGQAESGYPIGAWVFPGTDEVRASIDRFREREVLVEPSAFHRTLTSTRRELFDFLKIGQ